MVNVVDLTNQPDLILTNDQKFKNANVANCGLSFILYYSNMCGHCVNFHPKFVNFAKNYTGFAKFFKITDNDTTHTESAINVLTKHCTKWDGGIPLLMVFCKNKLLTYHLGDCDENTLKKFVTECESNCKCNKHKK